MKSHTASVRQAYVTAVRRQMAADTRFTTLTAPWTDVRSTASPLNTQIAKKAGSE